MIVICWHIMKGIQSPNPLHPPPSPLPIHHDEKDGLLSDVKQSIYYHLLYMFLAQLRINLTVGISEGEGLHGESIGSSILQKSLPIT